MAGKSRDRADPLVGDIQGALQAGEHVYTSECFSFAAELGMVAERIEGLATADPARAASLLENRRSGMSPDMAVRIAKATATSPESWLNMQRKLDLWHAQRRAPSKVRRLRDVGRGDLPRWRLTRRHE